MRGRVALLALLALLMTRAPAIADDPVMPLPDEDARDIAANLGAGVVGKALPAPVIADAGTYFPLVERERVYRVTVGEKAGQSQTLRLARGRRPGGTPAWRFQLSPTQNAFLSQTEAGDLLMSALSDVDEGVVVVTTPPNAFVLKGMRPGESRELAQAVSIDYLDTPDRVDYSGSVTGTFTYVGAYEVTVPAGTFQTVLLRTKCQGKVGPAHTEDTAYYFLAPRVGPVAMITQEDAEAFWVIHIDTTLGKALVSK